MKYLRQEYLLNSLEFIRDQSLYNALVVKRWAWTKNLQCSSDKQHTNLLHQYTINEKSQKHQSPSKHLLDLLIPPHL